MKKRTVGDAGPYKDGGICLGKLPQRKTIRLKEYDYNTPGVYFLTMCTENRRCILSRIVGTGVLDGPKIELLPCGEVVERTLLQMGSFYKHILIEDFVIMPNHVHILLKITEDAAKENTISTAQNTAVSRFVSTLKRFTHREWGGGIWQPRSYDHVIRDQDDFEIHRKYIKEKSVRMGEGQIVFPGVDKGRTVEDAGPYG